MVLCGCFSRSAVCGYVTGTGVQWSLPALAGALFVIQYLSCYLAGLIQRDIQDEKLDDKFLYVFPQFWIQVPLTAVGWFFMSGYY